MKTKEIDVWVNIDNCDEVVDICLEETSFFTKAKLIIEIPERKKEFTESELYGLLASELVNEYEDGIILSRVVEGLFNETE